MPALAAWRRQRVEYGKKGQYEASLFFDSDIIEAPSKAMNIPGSPVSIFAREMTPEIQPLDLPGSWVVVGKGGRAVKNVKMYDEPKRRKKRQRNRRAKKETDPDVLSVLEESPSSSRCLDALARSEAQRTKDVLQGREKKYWVRYQQEKQSKREARDALVAALEARDGARDGASEQESLPSAERARRTHDKARRTRIEKLRRKERFAAAAARCAWPADDDEKRAESPTARRKDASARLKPARPWARLTGNEPLSAKDKRKAAMAAPLFDDLVAANKAAKTRKNSWSSPKKKKSCSIA